MKTIILAATVWATLACHAVHAQTSTKGMDLVSGECDATSHIAEGPRDADLRKRQSRYFCDSAVIMRINGDPHHLLIQFTQRREHLNTVLGFAGYLEQDGIMMSVERVYFPGSQAPVFATEANCKFFFTGKKLGGIFCGAMIDQEDRRTVAIVAFQLQPPM
jgi:hypothetical protein